jgi:hypothetical protein
VARKKAAAAEAAAAAPHHDVNLDRSDSGVRPVLATAATTKKEAASVISVISDDGRTLVVDGSTMQLMDTLLVREGRVIMFARDVRSPLHGLKLLLPKCFDLEAELQDMPLPLTAQGIEHRAWRLALKHLHTKVQAGMCIRMMGARWDASVREEAMSAAGYVLYDHHQTVDSSS